MAPGLTLTPDPNGSFWLSFVGENVNEWHFRPGNPQQSVIHYLQQTEVQHTRKRARLSLSSPPITDQAKIGRTIYDFVDHCCKVHVKQFNAYPNVNVEWYAMLKQPAFLSILPQSPYLPGFMTLVQESASVDDLVAMHLYAKVVACKDLKELGRKSIVLFDGGEFHEFEIYQSTMGHATISSTDLLNAYSGTYDMDEDLPLAGEFVVSHLLCEMIMYEDAIKDRDDAPTILALRLLVSTYPWTRPQGLPTTFFQGLAAFFFDRWELPCGEDVCITMQSLRESKIGPLKFTYDLDKASPLGSGTYGRVYETISKNALKVYSPNPDDVHGLDLVLQPIQDSRMWSKTLVAMEASIGDLIVRVLHPYEYALVKRNGEWLVRLVSLMEKCDPLPHPMPLSMRTNFALWMLNVCTRLKDAGFVAPDLKIANVGVINGRFCLIDLDGIDTQASAPTLWENEGDMWWPAGTHAAIAPESALAAPAIQTFIDVMEIGDHAARWDLATYQMFVAGFVTAVAVFYQEHFYLRVGLATPPGDGFFKPRFEAVAKWVAALKGGLDPMFQPRLALLRTWWDAHPRRAQKSQFLASFKDLTM
jgi:hypothetical protein